MPILAEETSIYPADLLDDMAANATTQKWWVLHTKPRQEKSLARQLLKSGIPFYLPLVPKSHLHRGRKIESHIPLFTSYVFLFGSEEQRVLSLTTNRVTQILDVAHQAELQHDLRQVNRLILSKAPLTLERRLSAGQRVRIRSGSLVGLEGTVIARRRASRLLVSVKFLQQGVSVEIDDFILEPLD